MDRSTLVVMASYQDAKVHIVGIRNKSRKVIGDMQTL